MSSIENRILIPPPRTVDQVTVWLSETLHEAARLGATDLHFFPGEEEARLWLRIDGRLVEACVYARALHDRAISRLKVMARCPDYVREAITEGRFTVAPINGSGNRGEARLSIIPSMQGEKAVVRLLRGRTGIPGLDELGFSPELCELVEEGGRRPQGVLLVVGPAGSGKSTTLASLLQHLYRQSTSPLAMLSLEDPPEIPMPFATQVAVDADRGLTFASGLRGLLRQDPEVLLVGEIRDPETAQVALNAALTGHRLFSSLHTLNAGEALVRLQDMGAAPYMLASAIGGILSQRLVRKPCPACGRRASIAHHAENSGLIARLCASRPDLQVTDPAGCDDCNHLGYRGRTAIGEWSLISPHAIELLLQRRNARELQAALDIQVSAASEAVHAMEQGRTTPQEIEMLFLTSPPGGGIGHD